MSVAHLAVLFLASGTSTVAMRVHRSRSIRAELSAQSYHELVDGFHANLSTVTWHYTQHDWNTMTEEGGVLDLVNKPYDGSPIWKWSPADSHWIYPFTNYHQDRVGALALHMLHRHGMAPLAASKDLAAFEKFYQAIPSKGVHAFVEALENFPVVKVLFKKMQSMTLDGLRNVHSYDHTWSKHRNGGDGCNHGNNAENCMLQASFSKNAHELLENYGFTKETSDNLHHDWRSYAIDGLKRYSLSDKEMVEGRLKLWAYEEAEFFGLCDPMLVK